MLAGFCPVQGYSEDIARFIVIGAMETFFPVSKLNKTFQKKNKNFDFMHIIIPCSGWMGSAVNDITEKGMYCVEYPDAQEIPG